jgi:ketosteroid isomerase-like protein
VQNNIGIVKAYFAAESSASLDKIASFLSDDFQLLGMGSKPLNKTVWLGFLSLLKTALSNIKIKMTDVQSHGSVVYLTEHLTGTHTGTFDLAFFGLPPVPASGKVFVFPIVLWEVTVVDGKITRLNDVTPHSPDSGIPGLLKALGVTLTHA